MFNNYKNSNECTKKSSPESFSSRRIGDAREINSCEGPPQMGCCSWKQTCCGGGCCEPILPNCCNSEQKNARPLQNAMVASAYSPWEMTMNGTTLSSILGNNETEEVLCSNLPKTTTCYGGECGKTPSQNRSTRNTEETKTDSDFSTIRDSDR
ncbi:uncharacterized protein LOC122635305 [Vespula pensylvanica]|uniref:uncharacterized protein LOC122635305 n=1 Tax=Vespula pensylvanica TaxID=30213 RepID=UPI001CBA30F9|nr:uncharacterized protein LOC122635305 [Vespula pensylvanica]